MYNPYQQQDHDSIIIAGIFLIVSEAVVLIIFFVGGEAVLQVLQGITSLVTTSEMATHGPFVITCYYLLFGIAFFLPVATFFFWLFRKERGFQFRRY